MKLFKVYDSEILNVIAGKNSTFKEEFRGWIENGFKSPPPLPVKWEVIKRWDCGTHWIETGTLWGETSEYLSKQGKKVITIEASEELASKAKEKFKNNNLVKVINGLSEDTLADAITESLNSGAKKINFWLDGHYSGEGTYQGLQDTPIMNELAIIATRLSSFECSTILIDDIRLFNSANTKHEDYPNLIKLVEWATSNNLNFAIENDVFIAGNDNEVFRKYANG